MKTANGSHVDSMSPSEAQIEHPKEHVFVPHLKTSHPATLLRPHSSRPKIFLIAIVLILLLGGLLGAMLLTEQGAEIRSRATGTGPTITMTPGTKSLPIGQQFTFSISLDTKSNTVSATQLDILFDPTAIDSVVFTPGSILPVVLKPASIVGGNKVRVALGVNPESPYHGVGVLGTLRVRGKAAKQSTISFTNNTLLASIGKTTNSLASKTGTTVTVTSTNSPTNTPTPSPAPTNTPTPGPSPTPSPTLMPGEPTPTPIESGPTPTPEDDDGETPTPTPTGSGNLFQNWWNSLFGPSPTPTPLPEPTPPPTAEEVIGYAIINGMCFPVAEAPTEGDLHPSLAECIGALNMQIQNDGIPTPTPTPSIAPKQKQVPFFLRWFQSLAEAISKIFRGGKK